MDVLLNFIVRIYLKYKNILELMILKVRKDFMVFNRMKWFIVVDFYMFEGMFLLIIIEEMEVFWLLFCEFGDFFVRLILFGNRS